MGTYTFRWTTPANEVYVTGTFDDWSKSVKLEKDTSTGHFSKQVHLRSAAEDVFYKFVVDDEWVTDSKQATRQDEKGNENNVLRKEDIRPAQTNATSSSATNHTADPNSAMQSSVGPGATTATLAGAVPLEKNKEGHVPGEFPSDTPFNEVPGGIGSGPSAMEFFSAGDIVPDFSTYKSATLPTDSSSRKDDQSKNEGIGDKAAAVGAGVTGAAAAGGTAAAVSAQKAGDKAKQATGIGSGSGQDEQKVGVNPLPATSGTGNPIHPAPGEKLPPSSDYTANSTTSHVKLDKESYEKSDAYPASQNSNVDTNAGAFGVPPVTSTTIPESSLPMGDSNQDVSTGPADVAAIRSAAGSNTTTSELAGQVPLEPRGVPEVVRDSQQEAQVSPEASDNPTATAEKSQTEKELKSKIPEEPPASEDGKSKSGGDTKGGATGIVAGLPSSISNAISGLRGGSSNEQAAGGVPETVKDSEKAADVSPEAAANPEAVKEKSEVEKELQSKVERTEASGEPAPTFSVAQYASAPHPQQGQEGGRDKDHSADAGQGKADTSQGSSSWGDKVAAVGAGATAAAAAVGGAAYSATQKAGESAKAATQQAMGGAKDADSSGGKAAPSDAFRSDPTIADEGTSAAIAAMDTSAVDGGTSSSDHKPDGQAGAKSTDAIEPSKEVNKEADNALNASKEQPAQTVATEAKQIASESEQPKAPATQSSETKKDDKKESGPLPGTKMLPTSAKKQPRQDSRDVSPMTRPEVTTGTNTGTTEAQSAAKGKGHAREESSTAPGSSADADKKAKRRSFFGKIKDKLKHHE